MVKLCVVLWYARAEVTPGRACFRVRRALMGSAIKKGDNMILTIASRRAEREVPADANTRPPLDGFRAPGQRWWESPKPGTAASV